MRRVAEPGREQPRNREDQATDQLQDEEIKERSSLRVFNLGAFLLNHILVSITIPGITGNRSNYS